MMAVVTISRECGTEGNAIGTKVADLLEYHFVFKKEIGEVFDQYGIVTFEEICQSQAGFWSRFDEIRIKTMNFLHQVIQGFAHHGNVVIMGRCGYAILQGLTDVLHVRIQAPLHVKVERILKENIVAPNQVAEWVRSEDQNRAKLLQVFYNIQWEQSSNFDLVIDTGKISPDLAVKWIVEAVKSLEEKKTFPRPNTETLKVHPNLCNVISKLLRP
jgi:cytidylate kinase